MSDFSDTVNRLPELPIDTFGALGVLDHATDAPVLTIRPARFPAPSPPAPPTVAIKRSSHCSRKYLTQVLYPRVICHPSPDPGPVDPGLAVLAASAQRQSYGPIEPGADLEVVSHLTRFFKLTRFRGAALSSPHWCTVKYGPWSAVVVEEESCMMGVPNHWLLTVSAIPGIVVEWYGTWQDIPPYPSLHVITGDLTKIKEQCTCCPGFKWCPTTNSCISELIKCDEDPQPA